MLISNKYIIKTITTHTFFVLLVLLGVYTLFSFLAEMSNIGIKNYNLGQVFLFIALTIPGHLYELAPIIILLGVMLGLGSLAKNSEIIVLRAAGLSFYYFVQQVLKVGIFFVIIAMIVGEIIAPKLDKIAEHQKMQALNRTIEKPNQNWFKYKNTFIHIDQRIDAQLKNVSLIKINDFNTIKQITTSDKAYYSDNNFALNKVKHYQFSPTQKISYQTQNNKNIKIPAEKNILTIELIPKNLSLLALYQQIQFLKNNMINSRFYEVEFYKRAMMPIVLFLMLLLAIPFVFGSLRDDSLAKKTFLAIMLSIVFQLGNQLSLQSALFYEYSPLVGAITPLILMIILIYYLFKKIVKQ